MEKAPIFVKVDNYKEILSVMSQIDGKIKEAKTLLGKINELKNEEDTEMQIWKDSIDDVERKIDFIKSSLGEPE